MVSAPAIVVLGPSGLAVARRAKATLDGAEIHGAKDRVTEADVAFNDAAEHLRMLFRSGRPIVGICAAGILVRALSPLMADKLAEPPVVALAENGSVAVPLLGGHRGANTLAERLARVLGGTAAITTAGDLRFGTALDAPPLGWTLANPQDAKPFMARLLSGASVRIEGEADWLAEADLHVGADAELEIVVTTHAIAGSTVRLVYHPASLALGVGCERGCAEAELVALVEGVLASHGLAGAAIALVASIDRKADEPAVHALAHHLRVPTRFFSAETLNAEAKRLANPSAAVLREVGAPGVAEGAALAATGAGGVLIVDKNKSARATCAIACAPKPIDPAGVGRARGRLAVVGVGPGQPSWRSPEATQLLAQATDWVGYGLYLDLVADFAGARRVHRFDLGAEEARVRHALALAGEGRDVALVCSGDPGVYAMAALLFELLGSSEQAPSLGPAARRIEVVVAPGISAFQAAAARAGAPIGHDFCAISLSDLMTPWPVIERRLRAAAEGDFAVALYNPRSQRRQEQIRRAMSILAAHRPADTPVVIASNLGRAEESVRVETLADFDPAQIDMLTVIIVGASTTRAFRASDGRRWVFTPRGYAEKRGAAS